MTLEDPLARRYDGPDKYDEIERVVGEGGFALVHRAMHRVWKRPVGLPCLGDPPADKRAGLVESFIQEGPACSRISPSAPPPSVRPATSVR